MNGRFFVALCSLLGALLMTGSGAGASGGCSDPAGCVVVSPGEALELGTILATSGSSGPLGLDALHGVEIALDMRGREFLGHPVELVNRDDRCDPRHAAGAARGLRRRSAIVGVVGTTCSGAALAASTVLGEAGIMLVSPSATAPFLTRPETNLPHFARSAPNDLLQPFAMAEFVHRVVRLRTAATVAYPFDFVQDFAAAFASRFTALGGQITGSATVEPGTTDFASVLASLGGPAFVYGAVFDPEAGALARQARPRFELGFLADASFGETAAVDGVYATRHNSEGTSDEYCEEFLPAYVAKFGEPELSFHTLAADAANMLLNAAESVAEVTQSEGGTTIRIGRSALRTAFLATKNYRGLTARMTCSPNGECNPNARVDVHRAGGGEFVAVWP